MQYSFACPIEGCDHTMTAEAPTKDETVDKLTEQAKAHLSESHPEMSKTDEEIRSDVEDGLSEVTMMV